MRIVERPHVLRLGRAGDAGDTGLDIEVRLTQAAPLDEDFS